MNLRELTEHQALRGIAIGHCCIDRDHDFGSDGKLQAHAHVAAGPHHGWICLRSVRELNATTVRHELGHLLSGEYRHNLAWARVVRELGGRPERRYAPGLRAAKRKAQKTSRPIRLRP